MSERWRPEYGPFGPRVICTACGVKVEGDQRKAAHDRWHMEIEVAVLAADASILERLARPDG